MAKSYQSAISFPIARKHHNPGCKWCGFIIMRGERYVSIIQMEANEVTNTKMHTECYTAFNKEYQDCPPGTKIGFHPHQNGRGKRALPDTLVFD